MRVNVTFYLVRPPYQKIIKMIKYLLIVFVLAVTLSACKKDEPSPDEVMQQSSNLFERTETPVFESPLDLAADPSIIRTGDSLIMYYSAEEITSDERIFGVVVSEDNGESWSAPDGNNERDYPAFYSQPDGWDNTLETVDVIKVGNEFWMYYSGYREGEADNTHVQNYEIGLAISSNGIDFTRHPQSVDNPLIARNITNENTNDRHALTSPGVVYDGENFYMIYAGWNVTDNWTGPNAGIRIMAAISEDGINWDKIENPLIQPSEVTYSPDINEATLTKTADYWYIPFSTGSSVGIARSTTFLGSYEIYPEAIATPESLEWATEVTAPDGIIENGKMRLWYHGVSAPIFWPWVIGYSEADYPLEW